MVFGALFGRRPRAETRTLETMTPEQQQFADLLRQNLGAAAGEDFSLGDFGRFERTPEQQMSLDTLSRVSDEAANFGANFDAIRSALGDVPNVFDQLGPTNIDAGQTESAELREVFAGGPTDFEDFFQTNIQDPMIQNFQEDVLPQISRRQGLSGFTTSGRVDQDRRATEALMESLTRSRSDLAFRTRESDQNRRLQAAQGLQEAEQGDLTRRLQAALGGRDIDARVATGDADRALRGALGLADVEQVEGQRINALANLLGVQGQIANQDAQFQERQLDRDIEVALAEAGFDREEIQQALQLLSIPEIENVVLNNPGQQGLLGSFLQGLGGSLF